MRGGTGLLAVAILALAVAVGGCVETVNYRQHEQMEMAPQPSGQSTNWSLYEDMEGGGR